MTFHELSEHILREADRPLTANEIWELAVEKELDQILNSSGKTPEASMSAMLSRISKEPGSIFKTLDERPSRFYLKTEEETNISTAPSTKTYNEKHLHPFLAHYALRKLKCYCKTINHSRSDKKSFGEWVHPDMIGCVFPIGEWDNEVLGLSSAIGNTSVKFISFELKKELDLSTLREKFFQTVSNSSWANQSYIVAAEISKNADFLSELDRLSSSFGVGVIELNVNDPNSSSIRFPAQIRENLDWETMNKLTVMHEDFKQFVKRVQNDLKNNEIIKEKYDKILDEGQLEKIVKNQPQQNLNLH